MTYSLIAGVYNQSFIYDDHTDFSRALLRGPGCKLQQHGLQSQQLAVSLVHLLGACEVSGGRITDIFMELADIDIAS